VIRILKAVQGTTNNKSRTNSLVSISADVMFKEEKSTNGNGKTCAIELSLPGPKIHASSNSDSFEAAAAETVKDLEKQLQKRKAEMQSH